MGTRFQVTGIAARRPHPDVPRRHAGLSGGVFRRGARRLRAAVDQHADAAPPAAILSVGFRCNCWPSPTPSFAPRFDAVACKDTSLRTLVVVNGSAADHAVPNAIAADAWLPGFATDLAEADTHRNEMAFWMYSSGSTGRPKGIVHLHHDMAYSEAAFARQVLKLTPDDICFSVPKIFFAYGFGNSVTFPFTAGAATLLLPGQPKPAAIFAAIEQISSHRVLRIADALHLADQGRRRRGDGFFLVAAGAVRRRGAFRRNLQRLEAAHRAGDRRGAGIDRSAAHLSLQPAGAEKTRRRRDARARL